MSSSEKSTGRWVFRQINGHGELLKQSDARTVEDVQVDQHQDYWQTIALACESATESPGEWQEIILGPPLLAAAVDRLRIRWVDGDAAR
jgi:hypothetical protein